MKESIEKLNTALITMATEQQGLEGDDLLISLKAIKSVIRAMEMAMKIQKQEQIPTEAVEEAVENVEEAVEEAVEEVEEEKPAKPAKKWTLSKAVKLETFDRIFEKAWADSGLTDEDTKKALYEEEWKAWRMDRKNPWAGFVAWDKYRPHSQEELEQKMYEGIEVASWKHGGFNN